MAVLRQLATTSCIHDCCADNSWREANIPQRPYVGLLRCVLRISTCRYSFSLILFSSYATPSRTTQWRIGGSYGSMKGGDLQRAHAMFKNCKTNKIFWSGVWTVRLQFTAGYIWAASRPPIIGWKLRPWWCSEGPRQILERGPSTERYATGPNPVNGLGWSPTEQYFDAFRG